MFNAESSSTLECSDDTHSIVYGGGAGGRVEGPVCEDYIRVFNTDDMKAKQKFILKNLAYPLS